MRREMLLRFQKESLLLYIIRELDYSFITKAFNKRVTF